jgi:hypothetical protein
MHGRGHLKKQKKKNVLSILIIGTIDHTIASMPEATTINVQPNPEVD